MENTKELLSGVKPIRTDVVDLALQDAEKVRQQLQRDAEAAQWAGLKKPQKDCVAALCRALELHKLPQTKGPKVVFHGKLASMHPARELNGQVDVPVVPAARALLAQINVLEEDQLKRRKQREKLIRAIGDIKDKPALVVAHLLEEQLTGEASQMLAKLVDLVVKAVSK